MFKKMILILLINSFLIQLSIAQDRFVDQLTAAKRRMVIAAVEFLATDHKTFPNVKKDLCQDCDGYEKIKDFARYNQLKGASDLIDQWQHKKLKTTPDEARVSLESFARMIERSLFTGGRRAERKDLPKYTAFLKNLKDIQKDVQFPNRELAKNEEHPVEGQLRDNGAGAEKSKAADNLGSRNIATSLKSQESGSSNSIPENEILGFPVIYYAIAEAAVIIFLIVLLVFKSKAKNRKIHDLKSEYRQYKDVKKTLDNAILANANLQQELLISENKNMELESLLQKVNSPTIAEPVAGDLPIIKEQDAFAPPVIENPVKYARYADAGDGFSTADLLTEEDNEAVFELTLLTPVNAEYRVTKNLAAQRYALANANYFLSKSCRYDTSPSGTIITDVPGTLTLRGNKWQINEPAKISFTSSL